MKVVILLAGLGRRLSGKHGNTHKSLIKLSSKTILYSLLEGVEKAKITELILVLGHHGNEVLAAINNYRPSAIINPVFVSKFHSSGNLQSLFEAQTAIGNSDYILINGDLVFDYTILLDVMKAAGSAIAIDNSLNGSSIDSPRVKILNDRITDLGRHINIGESDGNAIGIYKFSKELSKAFFKDANEILKKNPVAGFHDPLPNLFGLYDVFTVYTYGRLWTDVDTPEDVVRARDIELRLNEIRI